MKDLGTLGGEESYAYDKGQVVGYSQVVGSTSYHAFIWENGIMKDLGTPRGEISCAYGINEKGQVIGYSEVVGSSQRHAFIWGKWSNERPGYRGKYRFYWSQHLSRNMH